MIRVDHFVSVPLSVWQSPSPSSQGVSGEQHFCSDRWRPLHLWPGQGSALLVLKKLRALSLVWSEPQYLESSRETPAPVEIRQEMTNASESLIFNRAASLSGQCSQ